MSAATAPRDRAEAQLGRRCGAGGAAQSPTAVILGSSGERRNLLTTMRPSEEVDTGGSHGTVTGAKPAVHMVTMPGSGWHIWLSVTVQPSRRSWREACLRARTPRWEPTVPESTISTSNPCSASSAAVSIPVRPPPTTRMRVCEEPTSSSRSGCRSAIPEIGSAPAGARLVLPVAKTTWLKGTVAPSKRWTTPRLRSMLVARPMTTSMAGLSSSDKGRTGSSSARRASCRRIRSTRCAEALMRRTRVRAVAIG